MLSCDTCNSVVFGFASEGDECFAKRCKGTLVEEVLLPVNEGPVAVEDVPRTRLIITNEPVDEELNGAVSDFHEEFVHEPVAPKPVEDDDSPLSTRVQAVAIAMGHIEKSVIPDSGEIRTIRNLFKDLGSIYRPPRGLPDMAVAREKHKGQFFTSPKVGELIWNLLALPDGLRVLESSIGSANLIPYPVKCYVTGIDVDKDAVTISRAILGPGHCVIADEMQHHIFKEEFEVVVGNPPYSVSVRDRAQLWSHSVGWDGWGRGEVVWLEQAALAVTRPGVVVAILPVGMYDVLTPKFVKWLKSRMHLVSEVILPKKEAMVFSQWPVSMYVWIAGTDAGKPPLVMECERLRGWTQTADGQKLRGRLDALLMGVRILWAKNRYDGPVVIRPWQRPKQKRSDVELSLVEEDVVLIRVVNNRMKLMPNGMGAQARMELLRLDMGERYDRKLESHIWAFNELRDGPPLLNIGRVINRLWQMGIRVQVDRQTKVWLKRRYRWYRRQQAKIPRWILMEGKHANEKTD